MADAVWPAGLDDLAPQLVSWTKTEPKLTERSAMDAGPAKVRRRFTAGVTLHTVELVLTRAQLATFREFWTDTIDGGAKSFEWREWESQEACDFRFVTEPVERPMRPRGSGTDDHWLVAFTLEQLPALASDPVTPPAPENEPPPFLAPDPFVAADEGGEYIGHADTGYEPPPNDPDQLDFMPIGGDDEHLDDFGFIAIPEETAAASTPYDVTGQLPVLPAEP